MRLRIWLAALLIAAGVLGSRHSAPVAEAAPDAVQDAPASTLDDQVELAVTVYNSDIALVRDVRNLQLPRGSVRSAVHGHRRHRQSRRPCTSAR